MYDKQILEENSVLVVVLWHVYHETTSCSGIESRTGGLCESLYGKHQPFVGSDLSHCAFA